MFCSIPQRKYSEFSSSLERETIKSRIPYMGIMELTYRCNQACCHCFCNLSVNDKIKNQELKFEEIKKILNEAAELGCFWILFTGGEVLIREDFLDIYLYAKKKGMLIEVFTNATLITDEVAKLFSEFPPLGIEISIYGSNPSVYDKITRIKGSFKKTLDGINLLLKYKIPFSLKTMLITLNYNDLKNMQRLAKNLNVDFEFDCFICPRTDGHDTPIKYRLPIERIVDLELKNEKNFIVYKKIFETFWKKNFKDIFICSAGINAFNINPNGFLSPCTMFLSFQYSLRENSFKDAWNKLINDYGNGPNDFISSECKACNMVSICPSCPAWSELETKRLNGKIDYLCEYALFLEKKFFEKTEEVENGKAEKII